MRQVISKFATHSEIQSARLKPLTLAVFVVFATFATSSGLLGTLPLGGVLGLSLATIAAITDFRSGKIYNRYTYPAVLLGLVLAHVGAAIPSLGLALGTIAPTSAWVGLCVALALVFAAHEMTGGGMGDVKLASALGSLMGVKAVLSALLATYLLAGVFAALWMVVRWGPIRSLSVTTRLALGMVTGTSISGPTRDRDREVLASRVLLGPFFAAGVLLTLIDPDCRLMRAMFELW